MAWFGDRSLSKSHYGQERRLEDNQNSACLRYSDRIVVVTVVAAGCLLVCLPLSDLWRAIGRWVPLKVDKAIVVIFLQH
ncbi:hypothetical protein J3Q64DRAFT_1841812 [Phycomyces blakesleeanus]|uniref:Uncharacterized protein n=1 Tax=Phycomyces blakesleeanus TaxID=4837 RepID=A0ABR3AHM1_PHYBL